MPACRSGAEELHDDDRSGPNRVFAVAYPRAGTYRIVVTNLLADDLGYVLSFAVAGVEDVDVAATGPIGHEPCETDGECRAP